MYSIYTLHFVSCGTHFDHIHKSVTINAILCKIFVTEAENGNCPPSIPQLLNPKGPTLERNFSACSNLHCSIAEEEIFQILTFFLCGHSKLFEEHTISDSQAKPTATHE